MSKIYLPKITQNLGWDLLALIAGALLPLAFAPIHWFPLAIICPALLLFCYFNSDTLLRAMWRGLLFGIGYFGIGVSWIFIAIHRFGGDSVALAVAITALLVLVLSMLLALQAALVYGCRNGRPVLKALLVFPSTWVLCEYLRSNLFTGFPWLSLGFSQSTSLFGSYAPLIGEYGLSWLLTLLSGLLVIIVISKQKWRYLALAVIVLLLLGASALNQVHWTTKTGKPIHTSLVQGNIPQSEKWSDQQIIPTMETYAQLSQKYWSPLVVWPEGALTIDQQQAHFFLKALNKIAKQQHATIILGLPTLRQQQYFNSMIAIGNSQGQYNKQHLVPFGEYTPTFFSPLAGLFDIPMAGFTAGKARQALIKVAGTTVGIFICYEIAYTKLVRQALPQAQLLINASDDAWFGHSWAAAQQLQMAQLRARQTGRYLLTVTNSGMTTIIDPNGRISKQLPPYVRGVLRGQVYAMTGSTPWVIMGDWPILMLMLLLFVLAILIDRRGKE